MSICIFILYDLLSSQQKLFIHHSIFSFNARKYNNRWRLQLQKTLVADAMHIPPCVRRHLSTQWLINKLVRSRDETGLFLPQMGRVPYPIYKYNASFLILRVAMIMPSACTIPGRSFPPTIASLPALLRFRPAIGHSFDFRPEYFERLGKVIWLSHNKWAVLLLLVIISLSNSTRFGWPAGSRSKIVLIRWSCEKVSKFFELLMYSYTEW